MDIDYFLRTKYEENQVEGVLRTCLLYTSVLKIKALWNSSENNLYGIDKKKAIKSIPDIENYEYVPLNNSCLLYTSRCV